MAAPSCWLTSAAAANSPGWWRDALREKRQNSFDDLEAVARDLIHTGVARKDGVAISGRSNGGVLVRAAMTRHPDLYSAVISGSPLHDMKRYSHLLAGASWIDEYGDPDKPRTGRSCPNIRPIRM
jgi:prolyl oligopeptidase